MQNPAESVGPDVRPVFLRAEWRSLVMLNYAVEPAELLPHVPQGVELDLWEGRALASMVGFRFLRTRVMGVSIPFHQDFEEVNLRFYVRRRVGDTWRRGVVFIREIVPKRMIALVAQVVYNEPYLGMPMRHQVPGAGQGGVYEFGWKYQGAWCELGAETIGEPAPLALGSAEEFIFEHYWGYTRLRNGRTAEYQVEHASWKFRATSRSWLKGDIGALYGAGFGEALTREPFSAFVAEGSPVLVRRGTTLGK